MYEDRLFKTIKSLIRKTHPPSYTGSLALCISEYYKDQGALL